MARVIERVAEHYEAQDVELGRISPCECGADHTAGVREELVLKAVDEDCEATRHPWRYWHSSQHTGTLFNQLFSGPPSRCPRPDKSCGVGTIAR